MRNPDDQVALQAVEFWSTVCEEEAELAAEAQDVGILSLLLSLTRSDHSHFKAYDCSHL